jgi:hypothetical protein
MDDHVKQRESESAEYGSPETRNLKSRNQTPEKPKKKSIDNKSEQTKRLAVIFLFFLVW